MVGQSPQQCFMTPLLVGTDGTQKMSKSLHNYIGVAEPPDEIYGKVMSISDSLILQYFELLTDVPDEELEKFKQELAHNTINPMTLKKRLAREIIRPLYSEKETAEAEEHFEKVVQKKEVPNNIEEFKLGEDMPISRLLVTAGKAASRSEANRLIQQGAVSIDGKKFDDANKVVAKGTTRGSIIKVGKRGYFKII